jgi:putative acyl-CoA dehydrogenase
MTKPAHPGPTHDVFNQSVPLENYNAYTTDTPLREAVEREGGAWGHERLERFGEVAGGELIEVGFLANENKPELKLFDRYGHRVDEVEFHPAYHRSMEIAKEHDIHGLTWREEQAGAQVVRSALAYLHNQMEAGTMCPITMTHAAIPALQHQPDVAAEWVPRIMGKQYDPANRPADQKASVTIGMGMTEKQGGSDVRANTTRAVPVDEAGPGKAYTITGHKWFFSAPMCDAWLVLAQSEGGLSCFLMPRWKPDGTKNPIEVQRLKDKLGDHANASSEVEFRGAYGVMIGKEGRGVPTIIEMVAQTRLDCMVGSAGIMRQALVQAIHHAHHRKVFGKLLIDQPLMKNVLADLAIESEAAVAFAMRVARAFDRSAHDEHERLFARLATPIGKYWICKRTPPQVNEAQECLGGAGYVEEFIMPRLYRQAPLNSIWEGSGNVQCLDVLRAMQRTPDAVDAFLSELDEVTGTDPHYDTFLDGLKSELSDLDAFEVRARRIVEKMALALQASILLRSGPSAVTLGFCQSRLAGDSGLAFGTLPPSIDYDAIIDRAWTAS